MMPSRISCVQGNGGGTSPRSRRVQWVGHNDSGLTENRIHIWTASDCLGIAFGSVMMLKLTRSTHFGEAGEPAEPREPEASDLPGLARIHNKYGITQDDHSVERRGRK
jgi:hypothetical protein